MSKEILKAKYGTLKNFIEVEIIKTESFIISNEEFKKDPCPGQKKYLFFIIDNKPYYYLENTKTSLKLLNNPLVGGNTKVTFIIPTIGRQTLTNSIQSLIDTKSQSWNAIIVFDGIPIKDFQMNQIQSISIPKIGYKNCAGEVRNHGIKLVKTEWVAFLDDDDKITQDYIIRLDNEIIKNPKVDVIVFRMINSDARVLPPKSHIAIGQVGISFVVKTSIFHKTGLKFIPNAYEDFDLLNTMQQKGFQIHVSDFITYLVR